MSSPATTSVTGSSAAARRMAKELKDYTMESAKGTYAGTFTLSPYYDADGNMNIFRWTGMLKGPTGTPYEGGIFKLDIHIPADYPIKPPKILFNSPIYHPNIRGHGICIDILKPETGAWLPILGLPKVMYSLSSLLNEPNPHDPLDSDAADLYLNDKEAFNAKAREVNRGAC